MSTLRIRKPLTKRHTPRQQARREHKRWHRAHTPRVVQPNPWGRSVIAALLQ